MFSFLKKASPQSTTRMFFATDLHGSERTFRKFINAAKFYHVQILIMGGDVLGKLAVPIIREPSGNFRATLHGRVQRLTTAAELTAFQDLIGVLGFYFKIMDEDEFLAVRADPAAVERMFQQLALERLQSWIELAETRLAGTGTMCYITGGNDDYPEVLEALNRPDAQCVFAAEDKVLQVDAQHSLISQGFSTPTPWHTPREVPDAVLGTMLDKLIEQVDDPARCIFNFHQPPVDSTLDTCPQLDWTTDPPAQITRAGQVVLFGAGSKSVRSAIEKTQPLLSLHGHIHESPGAVRIGNTLCVNPGSEYGEGVLRGCILNLSAGRIDSYQLTSG